MVVLGQGLTIIYSCFYLIVNLMAALGPIFIFIHIYQGVPVVFAILNS